MEGKNVLRDFRCRDK